MQIIDTNSLINYPEIIEFCDSVTTIPCSVVNELDRLKLDPRVSLKARIASRTILRGLGSGSIEIVGSWENAYADKEISALCAKTDTVITEDINLTIQLLNKEVNVMTPDQFINRGRFVESPFGIKKTENGIGHFGSNGFTAYKDKKIKLHSDISVSHSNVEQAMLIGGLYDEEIKLLIVTGVAGTGKTFLTLAAGLNLVEKGKYSTIYWAVPPEHIECIDKYGYVPGSLDEKMSLFTGGFLDNACKLGYDTEMLLKDKVVQYIPFTLTRGMSMSHSILVLDEAQNASKKALKTLLTRVDETCKVILLGDLEQSDRFDTLYASGFYQVIKTFGQNYPFTATIRLEKNRRGALSELATKVL